MLEERGPNVPVVGEDRVGVLAAYVQTNRDRFTDEALREAARTAGYTDAEIVAAWSAAADPRKAIPTERRTNVGAVIAIAVGFALAVYGAGALLGLVGVGDIAAIVGIGLLLAGIVGWVLLRDSRPSLAAGLGWGVLLAVGLPLIIVLGILGICLVGASIPVGPQ
jgi:hypothetical protein